jgi:hypothetical protein
MLTLLLQMDRVRGAGEAIPEGGGRDAHAAELSPLRRPAEHGRVLQRRGPLVGKRILFYYRNIIMKLLYFDHLFQGCCQPRTVFVDLTEYPELLHELIEEECPSQTECVVDFLETYQMVRLLRRF